MTGPDSHRATGRERTAVWAPQLGFLSTAGAWTKCPPACSGRWCENVARAVPVAEPGRLRYIRIAVRLCSPGSDRPSGACWFRSDRLGCMREPAPLANLDHYNTVSKAADLRHCEERLPGRKRRLKRTAFIFTLISLAEFKRGSVVSGCQQNACFPATCSRAALRSVAPLLSHSGTDPRIHRRDDTGTGYTVSLPANGRSRSVAGRDGLHRTVSPDRRSANRDLPGKEAYRQQHCCSRLYRPACRSALRGPRPIPMGYLS